MSEINVAFDAKDILVITFAMSTIQKMVVVQGELTFKEKDEILDDISKVLAKIANEVSKLN